MAMTTKPLNKSSVETFSGVGAIEGLQHMSPGPHNSDIMIGWNGRTIIKIIGTISTVGWFADRGREEGIIHWKQLQKD